MRPVSVRERRTYRRRGITHICFDGLLYGTQCDSDGSPPRVEIIDRPDGCSVEVAFDGRRELWPIVDLGQRRPVRPGARADGRFVVVGSNAASVRSNSFSSLVAARDAARKMRASIDARTWDEKKLGQIWDKKRWASGPMGRIDSTGTWIAGACSTCER